MRRRIHSEGFALISVLVALSILIALLVPFLDSIFIEADSTWGVLKNSRTSFASKMSHNGTNV